jgi:hypothetical protein
MDKGTQDDFDTTIRVGMIDYAWRLLCGINTWTSGMKAGYGSNPRGDANSTPTLKQARVPVGRVDASLGPII